MPNIAIVWDFDGTLTPLDSTSLVVDLIDPSIKNVDINSDKPISEAFWKSIRTLSGDKKVTKNKDNIVWQHTLASDAPIWMYSLSQLASNEGIGLAKEYFETIVHNVKLYPRVKKFLEKLKQLENDELFKTLDLKISHFVVSAGLRDLIRLVFEKDLVKWVWGCEYVVASSPGSEVPENIPKYCMDETAKTRALFEISKGTFKAPRMNAVNNLVPADKLFCPFENIIYIGDGFSDVPALSLVRSKGGMGIVVFDKELLSDQNRLLAKIGQIKKDQRADLITEADFKTSGSLYKAIHSRCVQIRQRYEASGDF